MPTAARTAVAAVAVIGAGVYALRAPAPDLRVYLEAVHAVRSGTPLYSFVATNGYPFTYPPVALALLWPLADLPFRLVQVLWIAAALACGVWLTWRTVSWNWRVFTIVLLVSAPMRMELFFCQVSIFLVVIVLADAAGWMGNRLPGGMLIGLAAAIKLTPLLFVPYLFVVGRRADGLRALVAFASATAVGAALWPHATVTYFTQAMTDVARIGNPASPGNQSIAGTLARFGMTGAVSTALWLGTSLAVAALALWRARERYLHDMPVAAAVSVGCATLLISPVSWLHHYIWTMLAGFLLLGDSGKARRFTGAIVLALMVAPIGSIPVPGTLQTARDSIRVVGPLLFLAIGFLPHWPDRGPRRRCAGPVGAQYSDVALTSGDVVGRVGG
jgi:alpha-1,2-mannosyltransferase